MQDLYIINNRKSRLSKVPWLKGRIPLRKRRRMTSVSLELRLRVYGLGSYGQLLTGRFWPWLAMTRNGLPCSPNSL